jgi:hypothetical protein
VKKENICVPALAFVAGFRQQSMIVPENHALSPKARKLLK